MKKITMDDLKQIPRPDVHPMVMLEYALDRFEEDKDHYISRELVKGLTFEDIILTLLSAKEALGGDTA